MREGCLTLDLGCIVRRFWSRCQLLPFFFVSPRSPPGFFVERHPRSCQSIRAKINQKGAIGRTWASLLHCAQSRFSFIKILNSTTPLDNSASRHQVRNNKCRGGNKKGGEKEMVETRSKRPRANHGNIMPQRPRAHHLSGVPAENDHWLRRFFTLSDSLVSTRYGTFICV